MAKLPTKMKLSKDRPCMGQHFLTSKKIAERMVEAAGIGQKDIVLEVGAGKGALTDILVQKAKHVIAVEKDKELVRYLKDRFVHNKKLAVIEGDILKIRNPKFEIRNKFPPKADPPLADKIQNSKFKIVANIPYYITSRFLRIFLEAKNQPKLMALMLQKEVAERIVAKNKKESLLSVSVKCYGQPKIIAKVSAKNFFPPPKVDSAIILIDGISKDFFLRNKIDEGRFFHLVKQGFSHKRKLLKNNLPNTLNMLDTRCLTLMYKRAEELSLEDWKCLFSALSKDRPCSFALLAAAADA
jgi:16S rRNA (adenine1518-N6/adenine1519-N6)-dimethyltransferase